MAFPVKNKEIRVRMAPSPTGPLHIGTARTTLSNWLFARHVGGTFILRVEDTDKERSKKEYEVELLNGLLWLGLDWDEGPLPGGGEKGDYGPYRDTERIDIHKTYVRKFLEEGAAYQCYCTKEELETQRKESESRGVPFRYPRTCRNLTTPPPGKTPQVIRLRMPDEAISFDDMVRGKITVNASELDDFAIARTSGEPLYNFAVAIDDYEMKISHVIRGEDHISNTPKQIAVFQALHATPPRYGHIPLILNADRSKMSKRFADTALSAYRSEGYLPEAMVNFLALLGWHPKDDREVLTREELAELFDIERVQKAGAVFNRDKLDWLNREYLKKLSDGEIAALLVPILDEGSPKVDHVILLKIIALGRGRANTLRDFIEGARTFFVLPEYETSLLVFKNAAKESVIPILEELSEKLGSIASERFTRDRLAAAVAEVVGTRSRGEVFWPLRVALSGQASSPDPIDIMDVLGKEESLRRILAAIQKCKN